MANPEHLAKLKEGVEAWNRWYVEQKRQGAKISTGDVDLSGIQYADLSGADLSGADLSGANCANTLLRGADLSGADLSRANCAHTDIRGGDFSGANLAHTDLNDAILIGANFGRSAIIDANFSRANLSNAAFTIARVANANFRGANLRNAKLYTTNFSGADFTSADLTGAYAGGTVWGGAALAAAVGLESVRHVNVSTVGTDTLTLSRGQIPARFLRRCGLADWEIENAKLYAPDLTSEQISDIQCRVHELRAHQPIQISPLFISYSHANTDFVDKLGEALDKEGLRYWRDVKDATAGRLDKVIEHGITLNPTLLLVLSEHSIESAWVEYEVDKAAALSRQLNRDVLCPIALDRAWIDSDRMSGQLRAQINFGGHVRVIQSRPVERSRPKAAVSPVRV